jgi:nucleoside-diphosphate-sugar epimerase
VKVKLVPNAPTYNVFPLGPLEVSAARRDLGFLPKTHLPAGAELTREWLTREDEL